MKPGVHFILPVYLNPNAEFSSETLDLYVDIINFAVEKVDSHAQLVPSTLESFLMYPFFNFYFK